MTYQQIQDRIVSRFWSEGLKQEIQQRNYVFPPEDLMAVAWHHTDAWEERLERLELFAAYVPEVAEHARQIIDWQRKKLADFKTPAPGEVYELRITDAPGEETLDFLCADFDSCFDLIDRYYEHFDWIRETEKTRYSIVRRKLLTHADTLDLEELGSCDLLPGKIIGQLWYGPSGEFEDCDGKCYQCKYDCIANQEAEYPNFLPDRSPVRYRLPNGTVHLGVTLEHMTMECLVYIIPLDGEMLTNRDFGQFCLGHDHEHIPVPDVDLIPREELPDDLRGNYDAFLTFLEQGADK